MKTVLRPAWTPCERNQRDLLTASKCEDQFLAFLTKKSMLIKDGRVNLNPLKKEITRSWVRKGPFFWSGTKFHFDSFFAPDSLQQLIRPRRTCGNAEVPEDYWVLRVRRVCFPTSNRLNTWPSPSGTNWSRQYHESTIVWLNLPHLFKCLLPLCHALEKTRQSTRSGGTGQVASDHGWLVILSWPGRSARGDEPDFERSKVGNHKWCTPNTRLSSGPHFFVWFLVCYAATQLATVCGNFQCPQALTYRTRQKQVRKTNLTCFLN